jgi:hypothetical protein
MDTLLQRVYINLLYLTGGKTVKYQMRPLPVPPPTDDEMYNPKLYPSEGGWPAYLRRCATHLLVSPSILAHPDFEVRGGEAPSELGELVSFPAPTTHHGVAPDTPTDRVTLFWFSFDKSVCDFILYI